MAGGGAGPPAPGPGAPSPGHAPVAAVPGEDRVVTLPNVVTFVRLCCVPLFVWLLFGAERRNLAAYLLAVLGATDWVDGFAARRLHQVSTVGKVLDPTADRLLLLVGVVGIALDGSVPLPVAVLTLAREGLVAVTALVLAAMGARRIDVTWFGKAGTFGQLVAYPLFLVSHAGVTWDGTARVLAWAAVVPALAFAYLSAATYVPIARAALAARRVGS